MIRTVHCIASDGWAFALLVGLFVDVCGAAGLAPAGEGDLAIRRSRVTGLASFVANRNGGPIPLAATGEAAKEPVEFLRDRGQLFGIDDPATQLVEQRVAGDSLGQRHITFQQVHVGVPVFSGVVKVHQDTAGRIVAANGHFYPVPAKLNTRPALTADALAAIAAREVGAGRPTAEFSELVIVDPGWYGDPPIGARLAYHLIMSDMTVPVREAFFVDAHTGTILDRWDMIHTARVREIYNGNGAAALPGTLARSEGQPPVASPSDANRAYDYSGDVYDYYFRAFGRDSIDDNGMTLILTVNSTAPPCPNAFWNGTQMVFCTGTVTDDVTAHEIAHGVTERTANLIYQNQPGQLNEAYSDIFGEIIDLFNGNAAFPGPPGGTPWPVHPTGPGLDTPNNLRTDICSDSPGHADGVRWLVGEDATAFGGAIRDMWNPPCEGDPDRANSPLQTCNPLDGGGVHSGSGIANHAFAILSDGKVFNGQSVTGIGPIKAAAVWYRALTVYLTPASDFEDAYSALNQAAQDLIGTTLNDPRTGTPSVSMFTAADATEVDKSLLAVEMNTEGACGASDDILTSVPPTLCPTRTTTFADDFEGGVNGWTVSNSAPLTPYDWVQTADLVGNRPGTAWFADDPDIGDCGANDESGVHTLFSPVINLPANLSRPTLAFTHFLAAERGWDGGNLSLRVNGGAWQLLTEASFLYNPYNSALIPVGAGNTNPLGSQPGWTGAGGGWGTSLVDLSGFVSGSETVQVRFDFGKDGCTGVLGWYVDDFEVYSCPCTIDSECDDGRFCSGPESCSGGICQSAGAPCGMNVCDDDNDACLVGVRFRERFEDGNLQGWDLYAPGSTATRGAWTIGNPTGTSSSGAPAQPENAYEGTDCAYTAHNSSPGVDDVDNGVVYLVSPAIDLGGVSAADLTYARWFFNRDLGEDADDSFTAEVSSNDGGTWVILESLGTLDNANFWTPQNFALQNFITLTSAVRLRFSANDGTAAGNLIEAAVDDITITVTVACTGSGECDDGAFCNGSEQCVSNQCQPGAPPQLDDGVSCTLDACNEENNTIVHTPNHAACDNGDVCDGPETCNATLGCQSGAPLFCDDGLFCSGVESCQGLGCQPGSDPCPDQQCDEANDVCVPFPCEDADVQATGSRTFSVTPAPRATPVALRVTGQPGNSAVACVDLYIQVDGTLAGTPHNATPAAWGTVQVRGTAVIPEAGYGIVTDCGMGQSDPVSVTTHGWGDLDNNGNVDVGDVLLSLDGFAGTYAVPFEAIDIMPCEPDGNIDVADILAVLGAFAGDVYAQSCASPCP